MPLSPERQRLLGATQWQPAGRLEPGDLIMGRLVHRVEIDAPYVKVTFDDGSHANAHVDDEIELDSRAQRWCRLEPSFDRDGSRMGWKLVLFMDGDWQDWVFQPDGHTQRFQLELRDEDVIELGNAAAATCAVILMEDEHGDR
jgi:hypothetical protein